MRGSPAQSKKEHRWGCVVSAWANAISVPFNRLCRTFALHAGCWKQSCSDAERCTSLHSPTWPQHDRSAKSFGPGLPCTFLRGLAEEGEPAAMPLLPDCA